MKAIVIETLGDAGGLRLTSVHDPIPKDDELLVRVLAAVECSMALSVAGKRERFGPALILAIGKHVGERVNTLVSS